MRARLLLLSCTMCFASVLSPRAHGQAVIQASAVATQIIYPTDGPWQYIVKVTYTYDTLSGEITGILNYEVLSRSRRLLL